jgi:DNA-binding MarR family transcriptional regulator
MENDNRDLLEQLFRLVGLLRRRAMHARRDFGPRGGPSAGPHQGQGRVLALLKLKPEVSQKELSTILDIRSQSLGELLSKLERQGYITRKTSEEDRRGMDIRLTEAGRAASEQQDESSDAGSFFDCLDEAERRTFGEYLERLIKRLEEEPATEGEEPDFRAAFESRLRGFGPHGDPRGFRRPGCDGRGDRDPRFDGRGRDRPSREED